MGCLRFLPAILGVAPFGRALFLGLAFAEGVEEAGNGSGGLGLSLSLMEGVRVPLCGVGVCASAGGLTLTFEKLSLSLGRLPSPDMSSSASGPDTACRVDDPLKPLASSPILTCFVLLSVALRPLGLRIERLATLKDPSRDAGPSKAVGVAPAALGVGVGVAGLFRLRRPVKAPSVGPVMTPTDSEKALSILGER